MDDKTRAIAAPFAAAALVGALGTCGVSTAMAQEIEAAPEADALVATADVTGEEKLLNSAGSAKSADGFDEADGSASGNASIGSAEKGDSTNKGSSANEGSSAEGGASAGDASDIELDADVDSDVDADSDSAIDGRSDDVAAEDAAEDDGEIPVAPGNEVLIAEAKTAVLPSVGWTGDAYWDGTVDEHGEAKVYTGYVVDAHDERGLQRYWIQNGYLFRNGLFDSLNGNFGYALKDGCVLRGVYTDEEGNIYLADNDGKLAGGKDGGWVVSSAYGHGLQRYWIDPTTHAAKEGFSSDGWAHYTTQDGYVLRGQSQASDGVKRSANNDGLLSESGWLVTSDFGQGLQRYWIEDYKVAANALVHVGEGVWTYARAEGYVVRGSYKLGALTYLADNDGKLAGGESGGWVVSGDYGQGLQRYWIDSSSHAAVDGYSRDGYAHYTTAGGYVLRGGTTCSDGLMRYADNDGRVFDGWVVTASFGQGLQRYWQQDGSVAQGKLVHVGNGVWAYARPEGYVVRGSYKVGSLIYLADNDGKLAGGESGGWVVSSDYGQGLQRYWIDLTTHAAKEGFSSDGWAHYTTSSGYVLRGGMATSNGLLLADNDGRLMEHYATSAGWFISGA